MMPTLTGWEICKYVRSKPALADTKVLMLTDFPVPVAPAISKWGILAMSATTGFP